MFVVGKFEDLIGRRFGRLTVISRAEDYVSPKGYHSTAWLCRCDCGKETVVRAVYLKGGKTISCGCYRADYPNHTKHGQSHTRLYNIWKGMHDRCCNPNSSARELYIDRGIDMCPEWKNDFVSFYLWATENGYNDKLTIDRIDNNKGYNPTNCRWVDNKAQQNNKRNNHMLTFGNKTQTMAQWAEETGIGYHKLKDRINKCGWSIEKALTTK